MRGKDSLGRAMPNARNAERSMQDARWDEPRRSEGQPQRVEARSALGGCPKRPGANPSDEGQPRVPCLRGNLVNLSAAPTRIFAHNWRCKDEANGNGKCA